LMQHEAVPDQIAYQVCRLLTDPSARARMREGYARVKAMLGPPGAVRAAAGAIVALLHSLQPTARST